MNLAELAIKRPIFVTSLVILSLATGLIALSRLGLDQFPEVNFPIVVITTPYPGAGPSEIETLIAKPVEDELSTISGLKRISSDNREGFSIVIAEFYLEVNIQQAEQQVRDHYAKVKARLPAGIKEATIMRIDPADQPIVQLALNADLPPNELYDIAENQVKPWLQQSLSVGKVDIIGGRKREIHVSLDRAKLKYHEISASQVVARLAGAGFNIPGGKKDKGTQQTTFRTIGEFRSLNDIGTMVVNFFSNEVPVRIGEVAKIEDTLQDEQTRGFYNGKPTLFINAYKQSGSNTVAVADGLKKQAEVINERIKTLKGNPHLSVIRDGSWVVRINVADVEESILIGILLTIIVVYMFLANFRSTFITVLALPNSLIGSFILMWAFGYTINMMTLLAMTLAVGLLVDDAIVVRENIFRHIEMGKRPIEAALAGANEVRLAVIATTLTIVAVFGPLGFLSGMVGQFMKQFGLTIVFAMFISLFDALTIAPMLSAYFAGKSHSQGNVLYRATLGAFLGAFGWFQNQLDALYDKVLRWVTRHPMITIFSSVAIFFLCVYTVKFIPKTFAPPQDSGEFGVVLDLPPGTNLEGMTQVALKVDDVIRANPEVKVSALTVGSLNGDSNQASFYIHLVDSKQRNLNTSEMKAKLREQLKPFGNANPVVSDYNPFGSGIRPFSMNIVGDDQATIERLALALKDRLKDHPGLLDVDVNFRPGKPEFQIVPDIAKAEQFGVSIPTIGNEIRTQIEGVVASTYREKNLEYDVRVRVQENQRDVKESFDSLYVPNINNSLLKLNLVAKAVESTGPSKITRQDRMRYVQIGADIKPGAGLGDVMKDITNLIDNEVKMPPGYQFRFVGQGENFAELGQSMAIAMACGILFIFLVLGSLYESYVTPFTIMLAMPLAICGAFVALWLTKESLNIFSIIGLIMLMGVAVKNSILLVDYAHKMIDEGMDRTEAIVQAGKVRLRPILMTSMALIAGTLPIAMGLNEASKQRVGMGIAVIGGLVSSTLLTLIVVPATFTYIDRFRVWIRNILARIFIVAH